MVAVALYVDASAVEFSGVHVPTIPNRFFFLFQNLKRKEREFEHEMERLARDKISLNQRYNSLRDDLSTNVADKVDLDAVEELAVANVNKRRGHDPAAPGPSGECQEAFESWKDPAKVDDDQDSNTSTASGDIL